MLPLKFDKAERALRVLCLGAHCDDIEIGCGGTILRLISEGWKLDVQWVVLCSNETRGDEARNCAKDFLAGSVTSKISIERFRDGFLPYIGPPVKEYFEELKKEPSPDVIFTHHRGDFHQDHRLVCELTWNTFRDHLILEYEIPKFDADLGLPNFFVHLDEKLARRKAELLLKHFVSQRTRHWFTEDTFLSLLRLRGVESRSIGRYAEGFHCRKIVI
ncbi:MAG TPA: PIG-L deacetylase family protein [Candidatus Limnocylindria bacterium]|nr:PIG-L deacetylase family protein [Candidatus Limnocylindria bacterium]